MSGLTATHLLATAGKTLCGIQYRRDKFRRTRTTIFVEGNDVRRGCDCEKCRKQFWKLLKSEDERDNRRVFHLEPPKGPEK